MKSSDSVCTSGLDGDAKPIAALPVRSGTVGPDGAAMDAQPEREQRRCAASEHLADAVELALRLERIERSGWSGFWLPGYWSFLFFVTLLRKGFATALIELWSRIIRWERKHPRGAIIVLSNAPAQESP